MTVQMISLRRRGVEVAPPPPATIAQQVSDQSQDLAVRLRALFSGWSYLGALQFFEMVQGDLVGRLGALCYALVPRYAQRTLPMKSGAWFDGLEKAQGELASVTAVASFYRQLHPDASKLATLIEKVRGSNQWTPDLSLLMANAATALRDFVGAAPLRSHVRKLDDQLRRERSLAESGTLQADCRAGVGTAAGERGAGGIRGLNKFREASRGSIIPFGHHAEKRQSVCFATKIRYRGAPGNAGVASQTDFLSCGVTPA